MNTGLTGMPATISSRRAETLDGAFRSKGYPTRKEGRVFDSVNIRGIRISARRHPRNNRRAGQFSSLYKSQNKQDRSTAWQNRTYLYRAHACTHTPKIDFIDRIKITGFKRLLCKIHMCRSIQSTNTFQLTTRLICEFRKTTNCSLLKNHNYIYLCFAGLKIVFTYQKWHLMLHTMFDNQ